MAAECQRQITEHLLVRKVRVFFHLQEMGMFSGSYGKREACRRNAEIVALRKELGITKREQTMLVNSFGLQGHPLSLDT